VRNTIAVCGTKPVGPEFRHVGRLGQPEREAGGGDGVTRLAMTGAAACSPDKRPSSELVLNSCNARKGPSEARSRPGLP